MSSWDDVGVDTDGDELLDWLLDIPDRYDVGVEDPTGAELTGRSGIKKHLRSPGDAPFAASAPVPGDDRPTVAIDSFQASGDYDEYATAPVPIVYGGGGRRRRFSTRSLVGALGVLVIIVAGAAVGFALFGSKGSKTPKRLVISTPSTLPGFTPGTASADNTTTSSSSTTTTVPGSSTTVPAVIVIPNTTTTTVRCARVTAAFLPADITQTSGVTSTTMPMVTTTSIAVTTTATSIPFTTTTTSTTVAATTTTVARATTTTVTTVPRTTTTTRPCS
jgi:hypothetical protein